MERIRTILVLTFIECFALTIIERAVYFLTNEHFGFSVTQNLFLAMMLGTAYLGGALISHRLCAVFTEKRVLFAGIFFQFLVYSCMAAFCNPVMIYIGSTLIGGLNGLKWPIVESYVSAGRYQKDMSKALGQFNISWSLSVPVAMAVSGWIIEQMPIALFIIGAVINIISLFIITTFPPRPYHIDDDHPDRPPLHTIPRLRALTTSSRWTMLTSVALFFVLAPVMPDIFKNLHYPVAVGTMLSGIIDVMRLLCFIFMSKTHWWHNRVWPLVVAIIGIALGFFMVFIGNNITLIIVGEIIFGIATGVCYHTALYYAMLVANATVDASGGHEGFIGTGFAIGPIAALLGNTLGRQLGYEFITTSLGVTPLIIIGSIFALLPLIRSARAPRRKIK